MYGRAFGTYQWKLLQSINNKCVGYRAVDTCQRHVRTISYCTLFKRHSGKWGGVMH